MIYFDEDLRLFSTDKDKEERRKKRRKEIKLAVGIGAGIGAVVTGAHLANKIHNINKDYKAKIKSIDVKAANDIKNYRIRKDAEDKEFFKKWNSDVSKLKKESDALLAEASNK